MGVIEPTFNIQESLCTGYDLIFDNWKLGVNQRLVVSESADIDYESLQENDVPGGIIVAEGDAGNAVFPLPVHTPQAGDYAILETFKGLSQISSGVSDFLDR